MVGLTLCLMFRTDRITTAMRLPLVFLPLLLPLAFSCGGGGAVVPDSPPVITAVTPDRGEAGTQVQFTATSSDSPTSWEWDFGGGALPATSTEASPTVGLLNVGTYTGTVRASNMLGTGATFTFLYAVAPIATPRILEVVPSGLVGSIDDVVSFAAITAGTATSWHWDFGVAATPATITTEEPTVTLATRGHLTGRVTASNSDGDGPTFEFPMWVTKVPHWQYVDPDRQVERSYPVAIEPYGGGVTVAYQTKTDLRPRIARSTVFPPGPNDWTETVFAGNAANAIDLAVIDGRLAIAYSESSLVRYAWARHTDPRSIADWQVGDMHGGTLGWSSALQELDGRPALVYFRGNFSVWFAHGLDAFPAAPDDWTRFPVEETPVTGQWCTLAILDGRAMIPHQGGDLISLKLARATTAVPLSFADFHVHQIDQLPADTTQRLAERPAVTVLNGRLVVAAVTTNELRLAWALVPEPSSAADWRIDKVADGFAINPHLATIDGRLLLTWDSDLGTHLTRAPLADPDASPWEDATLPGTSSFVGAPAAAVNGGLVVVYSPAATVTDPNRLTLAISPHEW